MEVVLNIKGGERDGQKCIFTGKAAGGMSDNQIFDKAVFLTLGEEKFRIISKDGTMPVFTVEPVLDNTKDSVKKQLDSRCWILHEK